MYSLTIWGLRSEIKLAVGSYFQSGEEAPLPIPATSALGCLWLWYCSNMHPCPFPPLPTPSHLSVLNHPLFLYEHQSLGPEPLKNSQRPRLVILLK